MGRQETDGSPERGTQRWEELEHCLQSYATHILGYLAEVTREQRDLRKVRIHVAAVEDDLQLAQRIWPQGKPVIMRMAHLFTEMTKAREDEHRLASHPPRFDLVNETGTQREFIRWRQAGHEVERRIESTAKEMFDCCDEIKLLTSIDVRRWLEVADR